MGQMGWYVHIHVVFQCHDNDRVAAVAKDWLPRVEAAVNNDDGSWDARNFVHALTLRSGQNHGPKGGLSLWGYIGNYTSGDNFVETLRPFWPHLLDGAGCYRVLVFVEQEQSGAADAWEIGRIDDGEPFTIRKVESLPFSFGV